MSQENSPSQAPEGGREEYVKPTLTSFGPLERRTLGTLPTPTPKPTIPSPTPKPEAAPSPE